MTVEISNNQHSLNSPLLLPNDVGVSFSAKNMPLPWIQALRGDSETMSSDSAPDVKQPSLSDCLIIPDQKINQQEKEKELGGDTDNWNDCHHHHQTPAWNKPLNAIYGVENLIGDATSWPDLSECTRRPLRSSYCYTTIPDTLSTSQEIVTPRPPRRQTTSNRNQSSSVLNNASSTAQQRPPRRNLVPPGSFHGGLRRPFPSSPQPPPPPPPFITPFSFDTISYGNPFYNNNFWGGIRPILNWPAGNNQYSYQNYSRREMPRSQSHPRGDRYDREHDKYSNRNARVPQHTYLGRGFNRPPPPPPAYMISPLSYVPSMHMPFIVSGPPSPIPPHMPFSFPTPSPNLPLPALIVNQIEHYFSEKNLETDYHLKSLMDDQGWVPITIVARFNRMRMLTDNIRLILDSLITGSTVVEVHNGKLRCRSGWEKWVKKSNGVTSNSI